MWPRTTGWMSMSVTVRSSSWTMLTSASRDTRRQSRQSFIGPLWSRRETTDPDGCGGRLNVPTIGCAPQVSGSPRDSSAGSSGDAAIVTGGGSGLGRAIARRLATAGTRVAVLARTEDQLAETVALIEGAGGEAVAVRADVSDPAAVGAAFRPSSNSWALSTSSSTTPVAGPVAPFWEADPDEWL